MSKREETLKQYLEIKFRDTTTKEYQEANKGLIKRLNKNGVITNKN